MAQAQKQKIRFLPDGVAEIINRRMIKFGGLVFMALSLAYALALGSYNAADPNFNHATPDSPTNILGMVGAYMSDVCLQALGLACAALVPVIFGWGWRVFWDQAVHHFWARLSLLPLLLLFSSLSFAAIPAPSEWPISAGLGGFTGQLLLSLFTKLLPMVDSVWFALGFGIIAIGLLFYIMGIQPSEWLATARGIGQMGKKVTDGIRNAGDLKDNLQEAATETLSRVKGEKIEPTFAKAPMRRDKVEPAPIPVPKRDDRVETPVEQPKPSKKAVAERQIALDLPPNDGDEFQMPPLNLLDDYSGQHQAKEQNKAGLEENARMLETVLDDFGVKGEIVKVRPGPVVTLYELEPAPGTKTSRVIGLADDIARSMSAISVRIATVPGRSVIGIEMPNSDREMVHLRELLASDTFDSNKAKLPIVLGKDIGGGPEIADLATMPHLLIAGTTGSGKSVGLNAIILSLLYKFSPEKCKFIMVDPKMLELSVYDDIPHLLSPVVTDPKKAVVALKWAVREMENRYRAMSKLSVRNIDGYNKRVTEAAQKGETISRQIQTGFDKETGEPIFEEDTMDLTPLPYIVVIVDEMADLMLVAGKEIEASIQRLAQMARAAGIHLIMATQRPSVDVITGTIKANFPTRISFMVTSKVDSRTILGEQGAEQLLGKGDMLHMAGGGRIKRVHGPFVDDSEVENVCTYLKSQGQPAYIEAVTDEDDTSGGFDTDVSGATTGLGSLDGGKSNSGDALFDEAVALVARERKASTSFIQRHLQIGYNRAARIIEQMEKEGMVSSANHVGKRDVLLPDHSGENY
ncbi:DNA translocase FtsK 4TM domain-containing protein [Curvivirga sp.]|uniref:FtsK/SpoIIIE family DNA translocase n=1 Tax=Curvivirga sp. TaxID=2856848 RepID=UPI003B5C5C6A